MFQKKSAPLQQQYYALCTSFHAVKCIAQSIHFLSQLAENNYCYKPCTCNNVYDCIQFDSTPFFHQTIKTCIKKMERTQSLNPIIFLLHNINNHHIDDTRFMYELFMLIFTVHKQILLYECQECNYSFKKTTLETILEVSEKINQLPIAGLLNAIDMLITELPPVLEKYEIYSNMTWRDWFKKYWWVPPIFGGWFLLKFFLNLQRQQFYYPTYYSSPLYNPRPQVSLSPIATNDPALLEIREPVE